MRIEKKGTWMWNLRTLEQWRELGWRLWDRPHRVQVDPPHPNPGFQECPPIVKEGMVTNALNLQFLNQKIIFPVGASHGSFSAIPSLALWEREGKKHALESRPVLELESWCVLLQGPRLNRAIVPIGCCLWCWGCTRTDCWPHRRNQIVSTSSWTTGPRQIQGQIYWNWPAMIST